MARNVFLKGGKLIDGNGGIVENSGVLIQDDKIVMVGKANSIEYPSDTEVVDVQGQTVMPGLIDAHVHLVGVKNLNLAASAFEPKEVQMGRALNDLKKLTDCGFTSVRDVGSPIAVHIKQLIKEGEYKGPNIRTSNKVLSQTGGHGDFHMLPIQLVNGNIGRLCDGVDEVRKAAREQFREGADFIKICSSGGVLSEKDDPRSPQFTIDEISAIVYEAEAVGSYVASHAQSTLGIKNALKAGVKTIEHGILIDDEGIEMMLKYDAILVPTLSIVKRIVEVGHQYGVPEFGLRKAKHYYDLHIENMKKAFQAGVKIALGTDFCGCDPVEHGENGLELELLVNDIGFSPMEAIIAGTKVAAESMALGDLVGTITVGKQADILVVDGDPLKNISVLTNTDNIKKVYVAGKLHKDTAKVKSLVN